MSVVVILLVLIILITLVLVFGGRKQRLEERDKEQERIKAEKNARKELKEREKELKKTKNEYVDILNSTTSIKQDISMDDMVDEIPDTNINKDSTVDTKNSSEDNEPDITFLFDDNNNEEQNDEDPLDRYIKEAKSNNIGYLNGDDIIEPDYTKNNSDVTTKDTEKKINIDKDEAKEEKNNKKKVKENNKKNEE